jgi:hypothetical protein
MPFTLAHPAAVLPLRRFCPRFFSFPALVVGSLCPDVGYCFEPWHVDVLSHTLAGGFIFCLPVGVIMLGFFYGLRFPIIEILPENHRKIFLPLCQRPMGSPVTVIVSILVAIWLHLLLDSFTHKDGWLVENLPMLQTSIFSVGSHVFRIFNLLWYACSFAGVMWLYLAWEQWRRNLPEMPPPTGGKWVKAILAGVVMMPIELIHHLVRTPINIFLIIGYSALIVIGIIWRFWKIESVK